MTDKEFGVQMMENQELPKDMEAERFPGAEGDAGLNPRKEQRPSNSFLRPKKG